MPPCPEKQPTNEDNENLQEHISELETAVKEEEKPVQQVDTLHKKALQQSPKLAAMITLSIGLSEGPQHSIVMEELDESKDGVAAWAKLIQHFERSTQDLRLDKLLSQWEHEELKKGKHPDELFTRLSTLNRWLTALGEGFSPQVTVRRFVSAIEKLKRRVHTIGVHSIRMVRCGVRSAE